jgi:hypothetical protein
MRSATSSAPSVSVCGRKTQRLGSGARDLAQHQVAGEVAMQIVDALEVIDVEHHHRRAHVVAAAARPLAVGQHQELAAVVDAGELVARGQHVELHARRFEVGEHAHQRPDRGADQTRRANEQDQRQRDVQRRTRQPQPALAGQHRQHARHRGDRHGHPPRPLAQHLAAQAQPAAVGA